MFSMLRAGVQKIHSMFKPGSSAPSKRELRLDAAEWQAKHKLGRSFFTRRLNLNTRNARIASLTDDEYASAVLRGWVK